MQTKIWIDLILKQQCPGAKEMLRLPDFLWNGQENVCAVCVPDAYSIANGRLLFE